ncbi:MAB_1171c family putative transporter [Streptomyces sp. NPDC057638]|uniref:MAB_1171c family putative transporter n=1 Tax=Streptomyces sp. NPDC057638 TaxID=3346190 RepID=UPI00367D4A9A
MTTRVGLGGHQVDLGGRATTPHPATRADAIGPAATQTETTQTATTQTVMSRPRADTGRRTGPIDGHQRTPTYSDVHRRQRRTPTEEPIHMGDVSMTIPAVLLFGAFLLKLPALSRNRQDILLRAVCGLLLVASLVFLLAAVPTIAAINRISGVPNLAAPVVYSVLTAFSGACVVLIIIWRGGTTEGTRRASTLCVIAYGAVIVALNALFVLGNAPVERLRDLDTYYATTPFIREMIVLYLLAHSTAAVAMTVLCWRWSLRVTGVLRMGLALIVVGYVLNIGFDVAKFAAVGARWAGQDWDDLSTHVARPFASLSALLIGAGFILPLVAQWLGISWRTAVRYHRLAPLARELAGTVGRLPAVAIGPWASLELRLTQREAAIHDGIISLRPYFDERVHDEIHALALARGHSPAEALILADTAMVTAARRAWTAHPGRTTLAEGKQSVRPSTRADDLERMSLALRRSPLVHDVRRRAAACPRAVTHD